MRQAATSRMSKYKELVEITNLISKIFTYSEILIN